MAAGRPHNSTTPAWNSKPCLKVCAYKLYCYLNETEATKSECARMTGSSRVTVIKWWNTVDWKNGDFDLFEHLFFCQAVNIDDSNFCLADCASECGITLEKAQLLDEIRKEYVSMNVYKSKEYDLEHVRVVGFQDYYWDDGIYYDILRRSKKATRKGKKR